MNMTIEQKQSMILAARQAMGNAWAPYSGFLVGAAVLGRSGGIHVGCNVENSSYPVGTCAERNAIGAALAAGEKGIDAVVVVTPQPGPVTPCGMCRQALNEFGADIIVVCVGAAGVERQYTVRDLLPDAFDDGMLHGRKD